MTLSMACQASPSNWTTAYRTSPLPMVVSFGRRSGRVPAATAGTGAAPLRLGPGWCPGEFRWRPTPGGEPWSPTRGRRDDLIAVWDGEVAQRPREYAAPLYHIH